MTREDIFQVIIEFVELVEGKSSAQKKIIPLLVKNLDQLALAYHFIDIRVSNAKDYPDPLHHSYDQIRFIVTAQFSTFGFYNVPHDIATKICQTHFMTGDAIDDLADIVLALKEILWRWQNTSIEDALWNYRFTFETHWGTHLRDLQRYVHDLMSESGWLILNRDPL